MGGRREGGSEEGRGEGGGKVRVRRVLQLILVLTPRPLPCWCPSRLKGFYSQTTSSGLQTVTNVGSWHIHSSTTERHRLTHTHTHTHMHTEYGLYAITTHGVRP